jgi:hypothetical protein
MSTEVPNVLKYLFLENLIRNIVITNLINFNVYSVGFIEGTNVNHVSVLFFVLFSLFMWKEAVLV